MFVLFLVPQKYPGAAHAPISILVRSILLQKDQLLNICRTHTCRFEKTALEITFRIATKNHKLEQGVATDECFKLTTWVALKRNQTVTS